MKHATIVANWKSNKTIAETKIWLDSFVMPTTEATTIVCASFTLLHFLREQNPGFELGAQDVSPFGQGAYTGQINARQLKELVDWVIIGHSERRTHFHETNELLEQKVTSAKKAGLKVIYCVSDEGMPVPAGVDLVAYEPIAAIGSGKSEDPAASNEVIARLKESFHTPSGLYGGSVTVQNVPLFVKEPAIDGVLVGGESLDPIKFAQLINASHE